MKSMTLFIATLLMISCTPVVQEAQETQAPSQAIQEITAGFQSATEYTVEVINIYPHDPTAFTQGLIIENGIFYESTGLRGQSTLREVAIESGEVLRSVPLTRTEEELATTPNYFGEGLELVNGQLIQLTWQAEVAYIYDFETFEQVGTFTYDGDGWGLCYDERYLYMSDSTQYLAIREPDTFSLIGRMLVTLNGESVPANQLNELECVGDYVYANMWQTDFILQIDKYTGNVVGQIDATGLLTDAMIQEIPNYRTNADGSVEPPSGGVLNGIAYNPDSNTFFITGKLWSRMFEVRFVPIGSGQ